jgi:hypothetical protein
VDANDDVFTATLDPNWPAAHATPRVGVVKEKFRRSLNHFSLSLVHPSLNDVVSPRESCYVDGIANGRGNFFGPEKPKISHIGGGDGKMHAGVVPPEAAP